MTVPMKNLNWLQLCGDIGFFKDNIQAKKSAHSEEVTGDIPLPSHNIEVDAGRPFAESPVSSFFPSEFPADGVALFPQGSAEDKHSSPSDAGEDDEDENKWEYEGWEESEECLAASAELQRKREESYRRFERKCEQERLEVELEHLRKEREHLKRREAKNPFRWLNRPFEKTGCFEPASETFATREETAG